MFIGRRTISLAFAAPIWLAGSAFGQQLQEHPGGLEHPADPILVAGGGSGPIKPSATPDRWSMQLLIDPGSHGPPDRSTDQAGDSLPATRPADLDLDGTFTLADLFLFFDLFDASHPRADLSQDRRLSADDVLLFLQDFADDAH